MGSDVSILSYLINNPDDYDVLHPVFKQSSFQFQNKGVQLVYECLKRCWDKSSRFPGVLDCKEQLSRVRGLKPEKLEIIYDLVELCYTGSYDEIDKDLILGRVMEPQRDALLEIIGAIDPWNFRAQSDMIRSKLDDLELLTNRDIGRVFDPFDDSLTLDIPTALNTYLGATIPTGWPKSDHLLEGGFRRGELVMPAALPGDGKSMSCISLTCNVARTMTQASEYGYHVYYCILDNTDQEVLAKTWANFLRIPTRRLDSEPTAPMKMIRAKELYGLKGRIIMRKWPRKSKTMADIRKDILLQQRRRGIQFSVVVIDYLDTVKPEGFHKENRHGLDSVTVGAAALAEELGVVVISPTQLHRAAKFIEIPDIDNLAEAFSKSWHAAVIFMILATKMERIQGKCRMYWPKTRRDAEKWLMGMMRNNLYQDFQEDPESDPFYVDDNNEEVRQHSKESKKKEQAQKVKTDPSIFEVGKTNNPMIV